MGKILSVAMPSYNVERYLEKGLISFCDTRLEQGLEVLIVNDGSTDRTQEIAEKFVQKYPKIFKLINKENGGHGSAVNAGIDNATGKYFRIVDGDDWVITENLVKLLGILENTDTDLVVDEKKDVNMVTGAVTFNPLPEYLKKRAVYSFEEICAVRDTGVYISIHTLSVKTELLKKNKIHLLEHIFYVDYEYIVKSTCSAGTIMFVDLEIYQYLVGNVNQSVDSQNYVKRYSHHDKMVKEMLNYAAKQSFQGNLKEYLDTKIKLVIHTHYKISLIFNLQRREGLKQAADFHAFLKEKYPVYCKMTQKRYRKCLILHYLRFDSNKLDKLMGRN